jgi:putative flippase GtrA
MRLTRESIVEIFRYGLGTVVAFALDIGLLTLLVSRLGVHYILAAAISFVVGGVVLYLLSVRFVFRHRRISDRGVEMSFFIALGIVGLGARIGRLHFRSELRPAPVAAVFGARRLTGHLRAHQCRSRHVRRP